MRRLLKKKGIFRVVGEKSRGHWGGWASKGGDDAEEAAIYFGCVSSWRHSLGSEHLSFVNRLGPGSCWKESGEA